MEFKVKRERRTDDYKVQITLPTTTGETVQVELSAEDSLILADELKAQADIIMDEVYNMPIVPRKVKALIDCGKISRLEYSSMAEEADTGCILYQIKAVFTDGSSRMYYYSCKFFENSDLRKGQLDYVRNIPIIFKDKTIPYGVESANGSIGYNLTKKEEEVNPEDELSTDVVTVNIHDTDIIRGRTSLEPHIPIEEFTSIMNKQYSD